ncbi:hypothetical protein ACTG4Q_20355 [Bradyrhizobium denitrificans]
MDTSFEYRSYVVRRIGATFSAESTDGERFKIRSTNLLRLTRAIDTLWNAMDWKVPAPDWVYASDLVDLDAAADAMLVVDRAYSAFPTGPKVGMPARAAA